MTEHFKGIGPIKYEGPDSRNPLAFRHYNADEVILGEKMREHLRFSVAYWHSFAADGSDPFGSRTIFRSWEDGNSGLEAAERRMHACFEFLTKLGADFYCFHDRDIAPEGADLVETNRNLDRFVKLASRLQKDTGVRLLWGTANLFNHPRYMNGAATNPDAHVFACAAAQVKRAMEATQELGGANYVFWGGREGYQSLLNTDVKRELDHMARFLHMAVEHKKSIGFDGVLLIEPKPKEPTKHQYDFDAAAVLGFLQRHGLEDDFKLNIESNHATLAGHTFEHELNVASMAGKLGSVDANTGDLLLGWDTDQFCLDVRSAALAMSIVLAQGGIAPGGLNFDAKVRRESIDSEDLFTAHISSMDAFAHGLRIAARMQEDGIFKAMASSRYASYDSGIGARIEAGETTFGELEEWVRKNGDPEPRSGKQEKLESILASYL